MYQTRPQVSVRGRRRKKRALAYSIDRSVEPLENLPQDLNQQFASWFYGPPGSFRRHTKERPLKDLAPLIQGLLLRSVNSSYNPLQHKYLTENLDSEEPEPLKQISTYIVNVDTYEITEDSWLKQSSLNEIPENLDEAENVHQSVRVGDRGNVKQANLKVQPNHAYIDRRPMLLKKERDSKRFSNGKSVTTLDNGNPLIGPGEDCDSDFEEREIVEIDCDDVELSEATK